MGSEEKPTPCARWYHGENLVALCPGHTTTHKPALMDVVKVVMRGIFPPPSCLIVFYQMVADNKSDRCVFII